MYSWLRGCYLCLNSLFAVGVSARLQMSAGHVQAFTAFATVYELELLSRIREGGLMYPALPIPGYGSRSLSRAAIKDNNKDRRPAGWRRDISTWKAYRIVS